MAREKHRNVKSLDGIRPMLMYSKYSSPESVQFQKKSPPSPEPRRQQPWDELLRLLLSLAECNGMLLAEVGEIVVVLPIEMEPDLSLLVGSRIGILRTDIPNKEYLVRLLSEKQATIIENEAATIDPLEEAN